MFQLSRSRGASRSIPPASLLSRWTPAISTAVRLGLAGVWAWAGAAKVGDPNAALRAVRAYDVVPEILVRPLAWGLPFIELALAVLLVLGIANRPAAAVGAGLLIVFLLGIGQAWARGLQISCGCFGGGGTAAAGKTTYLADFSRDALLLGLHGWLCWRPSTLFALALDQ